ncbi:MAG: GNAT family N-acetyltransferase [Alphaproteobacteria bacterium]
MTVRRANIDDWEAISAIDKTAWALNRNSDFIADGEHVWRVWVEYAFVAVSLESGDIAGFILAFPTVQENLFFLHKILIKPEFRGRSHGDKLMRFCNDYADAGGISLKLTTDSNNIAMQALAKRSGYSEEDFVKGYYRSNEDRYVLVRAPKLL